MFMYPHLTHNILSLSTADLPDALFSVNLTPRLEMRFYVIYTAKKLQGFKLFEDETFSFTSILNQEIIPDKKVQ
jgi:hypothetical protein